MSHPPTDWLPPELLRASACTRLLWMILLLMVRDKRSRLIMSLKGNQISLMMDDSEMVPPPRHLLPAFVKLARQITRNNRSLDWSYKERKRKRRLIVIFNYANGDPAIQINAAMNNVLQIEETKRQAARAEQRSGLVIAALIWLVFFLLILVIVIQAAS